MTDFKLKHKNALEAYEKAYKGAIEKMKSKIFDDGVFVLDRKDLEEIFPELKESEDEKTKRILHSISSKISFHLRDIFTEEEFQCFDAWSNAWLEKQGSEPNWCYHKVDLSNCSEEYRKAYYDGWNNCNMQHSQCKSESNDVVKCLINGMKFYYEDNEDATWGTEKFSMKVKDILSWLEKVGEPVDKIVKRAMNEKQRVLLTETNGDANIDWDTRSLQDVKLLLEYGLDYVNKLEKQGEQETLCDKCRKEHPSHSCQDITALGRCAVEHEQRPVDKVEPKFHKGDWVVFNGLILRIDEIVDGYYRTTSIGGILNSYDWNIDNAARLWTIQDAKDGDVLYYISDNNTEYILMYKGINRYNNIDSYFRYNSIVGFAINIPSVLSANNDNITPATKEQRDLLFQKMHDAGYEWDAEKKKLL